MNAPITLKMLADWGGPRVLHDAQSIVDRGLVQEAIYEPPRVRGVVLWSNRPLRTALRLLPDGTVESECPCWANTERGIVCPHVVAIALTLVMRQTDPRREEKHEEELRHARRLETTPEDAYITRAHNGTPGAVPAVIRITLAAGWQERAARDSRVAVVAEAVYRGHTQRLDDIPRDVPLRFSREDEALLFVLEDISEGPARGDLDMGLRDFLGLLRLKAGSALVGPDGGDLTANKASVVTHLKMDLEEATGALVLAPHTELPFLGAGEQPLYLVNGRAGWAYGAGNFWPLENLLPEPYHGVYQGSITVARPQVLRFIRDELPVLSSHARVESTVTPDLFTVEPAIPAFHLEVHGSPASLSATLHAQYEPCTLVAGKPDPREHFGIPDPEDVLRYTVRNGPAERQALEVAARAGLAGPTGDQLSSIVGNRNVLNFLGGRLPALRRLGWKVTIEGRVAPYYESLDVVTPVVHIEDQPAAGWFDVGFAFDAGAAGSLSSADVQLALRRGECFAERDGRTCLIDADAVESVLGVFSDCATEEADLPGHFRMSGVYAPFLRSSLGAIEAVDIEESPAWRERAMAQNRDAEMKPVPLPEPLQGMLRPYQRYGVNWLRFLEECGLAGLLADEMGLGKTVQTLAWLQLDRVRPEARGRPALIVCPTSIVENWAEECARFVPALRVGTVVGPDRERKWSELGRFHVAITSYAILRRDIETACQQDISVVVLDEAQHIKNRSTQNALAAKRLRAVHRLVLTGTPIENSVADLWSIMDFLMPGYLGGPDRFRSTYEAPIAKGGPDAEISHRRLKRKLRPFLLRRLKTDVARDLPPKIERTAFCTLSEDQKTVYRELLAASQRRIREMVASHGFNHCRMEILSTLMRLRQTCCHLELLKLPDLRPEAPSAKTELFFELLDEALDSNHRILVFSQFVSMLTILRREMEARGLGYCYLDGSTKDRLRIVHQFNTSREIPAFLISLKAGGTGLNLTGADMVIHFDPWWNPAVEDQATDRAYRIGQKRTVYSVKLITRGTVEEKVMELQQRKKSVISATIESDEQVMKDLSWEDIQGLLDL